MNTDLKYMPVLRFRREEQLVLQQFYFGKHIYPCLEVVNATGETATKIDDEQVKKIQQLQAAVIRKTYSERVFMDLPVHMNTTKDMMVSVITFLKSIAHKRAARTEYMLAFKELSKKVIPVISTFSQRTGELNSILLQEKDLRTSFETLAFRTFPKTFINDLAQVEQVARPNDFLIVDICDYTADPADEDMITISDKLQKFNNCHITLVSSALDESLTNIGLDHGEPIYDADNRLLKTYKQLHAHSFGDFCGIKKARIPKGGGQRSPGFIMYNPLDNRFYGYRGSLNDKGKSNENLDDFHTIIVPDVMKSDIVRNMQSSVLPYLTKDNRGWQMILEISAKHNGMNMAKYKRIAMEHYLHCMRTNINAGIL